MKRTIVCTVLLNEIVYMHLDIDGHRNTAKLVLNQVTKILNER